MHPVQGPSPPEIKAIEGGGVVGEGCWGRRGKVAGRLANSAQGLKRRCPDSLDFTSSRITYPDVGGVPSTLSLSPMFGYDMCDDDKFLALLLVRGVKFSS